MASTEEGAIDTIQPLAPVNSESTAMAEEQAPGMFSSVLTIYPKTQI
jgi:hypothetical protein